MAVSLRNIFYSLTEDRQSEKWEHYLDVYERWAGHYRGRAPNVCEVGILNGGSLDMWLEYFGEGTTVVGVDVVKSKKRFEEERDGRVHIEIGDQGDREFWSGFKKKYAEPFDIFMDDGGHTQLQQIVTMEQMWQTVKPGGLYIVEDTHTSYWPSYGGQYTGGIGGVCDSGEGGQNFTDYAKNLADVVNWHHMQHRVNGVRLPSMDEKWWELYSSVLSVSFYDSMVVIEKGKDGVKPAPRHQVKSGDREWRGSASLSYSNTEWQPIEPYYITLKRRQNGG